MLVVVFLSAECYIQTKIDVLDPTSCRNSYYYNSTNSTCDECSTAIINCYKCLNSTFCTECQGSDLSLVDGKF